jgi:Na+-driven multidrug efflux pump
MQTSNANAFLEREPLGKLMRKFSIPCIIISVVVGMAAGCIPIVGYNVGAGRDDRAKGLFTRLLIAEASAGVLALIAVEFFPRAFLGIFGAANESAYYTDFGVKSFRVFLCMMPLACVNKAAFIYLQSLGRAWASASLSMLREVVFGVGFALLLPLFWSLDGILYSMPVSDVITFAASMIVIFNTYKALSADIISR